MGQILLQLLADMVFESAAGRRRSFAREMDRYFEERGLTARPVPRDETRAR